jgi:hypothetical protein
MPLEHLMKNDAVHEPAETDAEEDAGKAGAGRRSTPC